MSESRPQLALSVVVGKKKYLAPQGWAFVTNDPDVVKYPDRTFALLHKEERVVVVADVSTNLFRIDDYRRKHRIDGQYLPGNLTARWRVGNTPFTDLGDIGRALIFAISNAE